MKKIYSKPTTQLFTLTAREDVMTATSVKVNVGSNETIGGSDALSTHKGWNSAEWTDVDE